MYLPLTEDEFIAQIVAIMPKWTKKLVWCCAARPVYRTHFIEKKAVHRPIMLSFGDDPEVAEPPKMRQILEPSGPLKKVQEYILKMVLTPATDCLLPCVHGCVSGRSTVTNARPHLGARLKIHMDVKDFFPSVSVKRVYHLFHQVFRYETRLAWLLTSLCCYKGSIPQGAPTSPMVANLVANRLDRALVHLANQWNAAYTRYVDDFTFSFDIDLNHQEVAQFTKSVRSISRSFGFVINEEKTSIVGSGLRMVTTGIVVNDKLGVPLWFRRNLRAALYQRELELPSAEPGVSIDGKLGYIRMVNPTQAARILRSHQKYVNRKHPS